MNLIKKSTILSLVLAVVLLSCCACSSGNSKASTNYTYGSAAIKSGYDSDRYTEAMDELFDVVSSIRKLAILNPKTAKTVIIYVWDTADGGKVACDTSGNYVYTSEDVSDISLALKLM